ncbi:MAG TPA: LuxR C-terminal-related transcriptional regulator [Chloroflexota bacterium]|jgi:non-specific serine/threonine protein kinase
MTTGELIDRPAPLRALALGNIPVAEVDAFIGREHELSRLRQLQSETRLLTLVGPGGVGKTRLALRLQSELGHDFPDGTWLVDLSPISDAALVPQALGDVLGVRRQPGQSMLGELTRLLRPRQLLLVLDNCEHLIAACAELVDGLLQACPNLRVLATSLQPLGAMAETTWRVPPLSVPESTTDEPETLHASEAVRLFVARVRAHLPDFVLNDQNARVVAEICRQLDGLPLALELVAARVESLGIGEVAARLTHRFELAIATSRTAPARQRTLQAALEWSCSLLSEQELMLLRRLSVFVGGWTLAAAEVVCSDTTGLPLPAVVDTLSQLVTKSLVVADHADLMVRYRLLETVRAYGMGQLANAGETQALQLRHADFILQLAEPARATLVDPDVWATLKGEEDNVRAALEWTIQAKRAHLGLELATAVFSLWLYSGHYVEGNTWFERLLELPDGASPSAARSLALSADGMLLVLLADYASTEARCRLALEDQLARGDGWGAGLSLLVLGQAALQRGDLAAADALQTDATRQIRAAGKPGIAPLLELAQIACELGQSDRARQLLAQAEAAAQARQDKVALAAAMHLRALLAAADGAVTMAAQLLEQALAVRGPDQQGIVKSLTMLGHFRLDLGQERVALEAFTEAIRRTRASGEWFWLIRALEGFARWLAPSDPAAAVRLAAATDRQRQDLGTVPWPSERRYLEEWLGRARRELGPAVYGQAWEEGQVSTLAQAISLAEALGAEPVAGDFTSSPLTPREQEVAILLARGLTNKQVAAMLVVSPATVRSHVEHILGKLDLRSRAQIAVWASRQGLLPTVDP